MANLVVYCELAEDRQPTQGARFALAQARLISRALGATIHAAVAHVGVDEGALDELALAMGHAGADRVLLWPNATRGDLPLYASHGPFLEAVCKQLHPRLFVFPAGAAAVQLAPALASRLPAEFFPRANVTVTAANLEAGDVGQLRLHRAAGDALEHLDVMDAERMVVCTLANATSLTVTGGQGAELEVMNLPAQPTQVVDTTPVLDHSAKQLLVLGDADGTATADEARMMFGMVCPQQTILFSDDFKRWWPLPVVTAAHGAVGWVGDQPLPKGTRGLAARWRIRAQAGLAAWRYLSGQQ